MRIHPSGIACHPGGDSIVVLGIGNVLWADEGFGVRCVEALQQGWEFGAEEATAGGAEGTTANDAEGAAVMGAEEPAAGDAIDSAAGAPDVQLIDGGTQGLYLVQHVQAADRLLIFDAIDYGLAPGSLRCIVDDEVPRFMGAKKMSLHQTGFQEVLMLAQLTGRYPREVLLIGCQPAVLEDYGGSLSAPVRQAMDEALRQGLAALGRWGARPRVRRTPLTERERITFAELDLARYEADRPPADSACRHGDERFMPGGR